MKDFDWKTQRKRLLGSPRHRWQGNVVTDLKEIEREGVDWIVLAQDKGKCFTIMNTVMNLNVRVM